jgi:hypothetical protein
VSFLEGPARPPSPLRALTTDSHLAVAAVPGAGQRRYSLSRTSQRQQRALTTCPNVIELRLSSAAMGWIAAIPALPPSGREGGRRHSHFGVAEFHRLCEQLPERRLERTAGTDQWGGAGGDRQEQPTPRPDAWWQAHPMAADTLLVIEMGDPSLTDDLETKLRLYQQARITNDWVVAVRHPIGPARSGSADGVARAGGGPGGRTASNGVGASPSNAMQPGRPLLKAARRLAPHRTRPIKLSKLIKKHKKSMSSRATILAGFFASAGLFFGAAIPAQAVTTWNWSFSTPYGRSGSGTFTTADVTPTANADVQIIGITGTIVDGASIAITSLGANTNNIFRWDGTVTSPLILLNTEVDSSSGVSFATTNGSYDITYNYEGGSN